ncbi:MAG: hypothetical protein IJV70_04400 [Clostridia bacterium]|nr:hypothetical protein [Clostridia bacterium]
MKELKRYAVFFIIGALGYGMIEILWRGHTHWSMLIAGGICFALFSKIAEKLKKVPLPIKAVVCALTVTAVELVFGIIFNIVLKMNVWDYSGMSYNFKGQICLVFSALWACLGLIFIPVADFLNRKLKI